MLESYLLDYLDLPAPISIGIMSTPYKADIIGNVLSKVIENNKQ